MQCGTCGAENTDQTKICRQCGNPLQHEPSAARPDPQASADTPFIQPTPVSGVGDVRPNAFNLAPPEHDLIDLTVRAAPIALGIILLLGLLIGGAYYYTHRGHELAELAVLPPPLVPKDTPQAPAPGAATPAAGNAPAPSDATPPATAASSTESESSAEPPPKGKPGARDRARSKQPALRLQRNMENRSGYRAEFKNIFDQTLETRVYASEKIRRKALERWREDKTIIEPNGALNDKYVVKHQPSPMPGFEY